MKPIKIVSGGQTGADRAGWIGLWRTAWNVGDGARRAGWRKTGRLMRKYPLKETPAILALIDAILARGDLADYHWAHSARADLWRRKRSTAKARASYEMALTLARQEAERHGFLNADWPS